MSSNADIPAHASHEKKRDAPEQDDLNPSKVRISDSGDESAAVSTQPAAAFTPDGTSTAEPATVQDAPVDNPPAPAPASRPVLVEVTESDNTSMDPACAARRAPKRAVALCLVVLAFAAGGWFAFSPTDEEPQVTQEAAQESRRAPSEPEAASAHGQPAAAEKKPDWAVRLEAVEQLRGALLAKAEEVRQLQQEYRFGVMEVEEELIYLIRRHGIESFSQAMGHRQVELGLRSIQSRQAYASGLAKPLRWLSAGSEELLFVKRLAGFDLQVLPFADGVDMEAHAIEIDTVLHARQPTPERLAITAEDPAPSLEAIWKRLSDQARQLKAPATEGVDAAIAEEVCSGDLMRIAEVTVLRLKTARCLAESGAKELFLNRVSELPVAAAQKLSQWPGSWLCLNGLKQFRPEAARYLFAWPGRVISMNGVSELSADATARLPDWGGQQIELMGLKKVEAIEHLVRFEEAGGKLFLPPEIRRQVDALRRSNRLPPPAGKEKRG